MPELIHAAIWPLVVAFVVVLLVGPVVRRLAVKLDFHDRPDGSLKPHERPIPYLGGLAIYAGWAAAFVVMGLQEFTAWYRTGADTSGIHLFAWIVAGGTVMMVTGLIDDRRHIRPILRLMIQAAVAGLLLLGGIGSGLAAKLVEGLVEPSWLNATAWAITAGSLVMAAFLIAAASNATNLVDGMDGLCAGVVAIAGAGFVALTSSLAARAGIGAAGAALIVTLSGILIGVCAAFLFFNFNPASMFMGDSGSLLLGFNVAAVLILFGQYAGWRGLIAGTMVFGFPIFDTALAILRRWLNKRPLFVGDRSHFYDQLRDRGFSVKQTVGLCYLLQAVFVLWGMTVSYFPLYWIVIVAIVQPVIVMALCRAFGFLRVGGAFATQSEPR
ncbi:MAG TPA: MraY family glycosyltransferase, partial [Phycisphaerae bacterium]|nr:MraY family glycosyltransferase [Phycisphaerae bacterium]